MCDRKTDEQADRDRARHQRQASNDTNIHCFLLLAAETAVRWAADGKVPPPRIDFRRQIIVLRRQAAIASRGLAQDKAPQRCRSRRRQDPRCSAWSGAVAWRL